MKMMRGTEAAECAGAGRRDWRRRSGGRQKRKDVGQVGNPSHVSVTAFFEAEGIAQALMPRCAMVLMIKSTANCGVTLAVLMVRSKRSGECASRPK